MSSAEHTAPESRRTQTTQADEGPLRAGEAGLPIGDMAALLLHLQRMAGNQAVSSLLRHPPAQRTVQPPSEISASSSVQRCEAAPCGCSVEERAAHAGEELIAGAAIQRALQRQAGIGEAPRKSPEVGLEGGPISQWLAERINARCGGGSGLNPGLRKRMVGHFGTNFGDVRMHGDGESHALNHGVSAKAFTMGSDIFLGHEASASDTGLMAHEPTHVVQQRGMSTSGPMAIGPAADSYEQEADTRAGGVVQRQIAVGPGETECDRLDPLHLRRQWGDDEAATSDLTPRPVLVQRQPHGHHHGVHRRRGWQPHQADPALLDRLLAPNSPLWRQLNPDAHAAVNCPATAAAVDEYLSTGHVTPAPAGDATSTFVFRTAPWSPRTRDFDVIRRAVSQPNSFVTVEGTRTQEWADQHNVTTQHWWVVANHGGHIIFIDAFGQGGSTDQIEADINNNGYLFFRYYCGDFRVTHQSSQLGEDIDIGNLGH